MTEGLLCYNRGCGKTFSIDKNTKDSCRFHPGVPVFHDAYKGWSCCSKKSTDFTEFLNIPGCSFSYHSNEKPPEPVKPVVDKEKASEIIEIRAPVNTISRLPRPSVDAPRTKVQPTIAQSLVKQLEGLVIKTKGAGDATGEISIGVTCKRGGCKVIYQGPDVCHEPCIHHPGTPIFHEGLKFWSCCKKRTTEFSAFLEQVGCESGDHKWIDSDDAEKKPICRYDWHQTGPNVIVSVYAKKYDPKRSSVEINPVRLKLDLYFPEDGNTFSMDTELRGIIDVDKSTVNMLSTKVEITLRKAELGSWSTLEFPRPKASPEPEPIVTIQEKTEEFDDSPVDLADL